MKSGEWGPIVIIGLRVRTYGVTFNVSTPGPIFELHEASIQPMGYRSDLHPSVVFVLTHRHSDLWPGIRAYAPVFEHRGSCWSGLRPAF